MCGRDTKELTNLYSKQPPSCAYSPSLRSDAHLQASARLRGVPEVFILRRHVQIASNDESSLRPLRLCFDRLAKLGIPTVWSCPVSQPPKILRQGSVANIERRKGVKSVVDSDGWRVKSDRPSGQSARVKVLVKFACCNSMLSEERVR